MSDHKYQEVEHLEQEIEHEVAHGLWEDLKHPRSERQRHIRQCCLLALNISILLVSIAVNAGTWRSQHQAPEPLPRCIHNSDMADARHTVEYEERTYTGALVYDPSTKRAIRKQDAETEYFGPPSKELDDNWHDLLRSEFPVMTAEESRQFEPELVRIPKTNEFHFEPDMFHTLHCVNMIRIEMSKSLYNVSSDHHHGETAGVELPEGWHLAHIEHCMDRLRQSVMCHGDLTPSPLYYWDGFGIALGRTGAHTCRKWQPIRDWMDERAEKGPLLDPL